MNSTTKIVSAVILILVLLGAGYFYYRQSGGMLSAGSILSGSNPLSAGTSSPAGPDRDQTLQRLNRLEDINIKTEFLSSRLFRSFENFGISIQPQPVGRDNPFTPPQIQVPADITDTENQANSVGTSTPTSTSGQGGAATTTLQQLPVTQDETATTSTSTKNSSTGQ